MFSNGFAAKGQIMQKVSNQTVKYGPSKQNTVYVISMHIVFYLYALLNLKTYSLVLTYFERNQQGLADVNFPQLKRYLVTCNWFLVFFSALFTLTYSIKEHEFHLGNPYNVFFSANFSGHPSFSFVQNNHMSMSKRGQLWTNGWYCAAVSANLC